MKKEEILNSAKNVLDIELRSIQKIIGSLNDDFVDIINICASCKGKVVFMGMGKSGLVAKKISSTMASLGTPSFFIHPAEAAHGDLGMLVSNDVVIMLSNSGETDELKQLLNSLRVIQCTLVGVFCHAGSMLEKYCDVTEILPIEREACNYNLAPTTSTTAMIAWGDALSVTLSKMKGFRDTDFAVFHPKGSLGKKLLLTVMDLNKYKVEEYSIYPSASIESVLWSITKNHLGAAPVTDENFILVGYISDGDIRRLVEHRNDIFSSKASDIMKKNPYTIYEDQLAVDAFRLMQENKISIVPIINKDRKLVGMISLLDIMDSGIIG